MLGGVALGAALALSFAWTAYANVQIKVVSQDPYTNTSSFHKTEVEPDTYAFGNTMVGAFQVGRFSDGGASNLGWSTTTDGGSTWTHGYLSGTTIYANPPGTLKRATDPGVAYDAKHAVWMVQGLGSNASSGFTGDLVFVNRSTDGGLTFGNPVTVTAAGISQDKTWIVCDNTATSPFYGNCYSEFDDNGTGNTLQMYRSTDGGLTWTASSTPGSTVIGGQPLVQPNGTVVMPIDDGFEGSVQAFVSTNGGTSFTGPSTVSSISLHGVAGSLRTPPLPSADVDAGGKVYTVWHDCRFRSGCSSNDIVMSTSTNGTSWTSVVRIPIDDTSSGVDHFLPGIAVEPGTSGATAHLAVNYYFYPVANCSSSTCKLTVGFIESMDGGSTWLPAVQVSGPFRLTSLPLTTQGYMVGDYNSASFLPTGAFSVFAISKTAQACTLGQITSCAEHMAANRSALASAGPATPVGRDAVLFTGSTGSATLQTSR
jgi:hypothetical protein